MKASTGSKTFRRRDDGRTEYYYSPKRMQQILEQAGFEIVRVEQGDNLDNKYTADNNFYAIIARKILRNSI